MPGKRQRAAPDRRAIASLGEQLADTDSLIAQRDRIISMTGRVLRGKIDVWLNEDLFRLPNRYHNIPDNGKHNYSPQCYVL